MKRFVCILLCFTLLFSLLSLMSCHGKEALPEFEMPRVFDENKEYEITFWAKNENHNEQMQVYRDAVDAFEALYPNIKINLKMYADYNIIYRDVITNITTETTPNICITYPDHIATYNTGDNIVVSLDELMADEKYGLGGSALRFDGVSKDEIVPAFLEEGVINGEQYAIPFMRSTEACYVNVDLVKALGFEMPPVLTWDFIWSVCDAAMQPIGQDENGKDVYINGQTILIPFLYKSSDNMMIQYLAQAGADYSTEDGEVLFFNDTSKEFLSLLADKAREGKFTTFKAEHKYPGDLINANQCIFGIDSTAGATWIGSQAPHVEIPEESMVEFELAVREIPQLNPDEPKMISQGPSICVFNKRDGGEVVASWLFAQFLLTSDVQIGYAKTEGYLPVTTEAHSDESYLSYLAMGDQRLTSAEYYFAKIDAAKLLLANLDNTFVTPVFNGSTSVRNAAGDMIDTVIKAIDRNQPTDEAAIENMYSMVSIQYHLSELGANSNKRIDLGKLPGESLALLITLPVIWFGFITWAAIKYYLTRKTRNKP